MTIENFEMDDNGKAHTVSKKIINMKMKSFYEWLKVFVKFMGPGYLVAVGYLDPGNWAADISAGSLFEYRLLFIILLSNIMAVILQRSCVKLGVVTGLDLAQSCKQHYNKYVSLFLYILCELAIIACDLAEVIGSATALKLLFNIPEHWGIVITAVDVFIILMGWNSKNLRWFELFIGLLVGTVGICLLIVVGKSNPDWTNVMGGFLPRSSIFTNPKELYIAMSIIGATVMPHNLYLHSSLVKFRRMGEEKELGNIYDIKDDLVEAPIRTKDTIDKLLQFSYVDSTLALSLALIINASILIVSASVFHGNGEVGELSEAYEILKNTLGKAAGVLFAIGLLCAGQSSTITGTLAGQYVMSGFLGNSIKLPPWIRRIVTRSIAIVPALIVALTSTSFGLGKLLVLTQVVLSLQLPFAIWPLVHFTSTSKIMTIKCLKPKYDPESLPGQSVDTLPIGGDIEDVSFANSWIMTILVIMISALISIFNIILLSQIKDAF